MTEYLFLISVLTGFLLLFAFYIIIRVRKSRELPKRKELSEVGFVVDTFHELVAKLKEKEKELDSLRKIAEDRADVYESYNEYILQSVPSGVISLDSSLRATKVNSAAEKILNIRAADVIGRGYNEIFTEPVSRYLEEKSLIERKEFQYTVNSGRRIHLGLTLTPLFNSNKEEIGQLMVFTDLTELKALEAQAALRDRLASLGEMAAGMAHELRNPMGVIAGYTKLLSKRTDSSLAHIVAAISKEVAVMDRVISDFLSFARPTALNLSTVDMEQVMRNCASNVFAGKKDIRLYLDIDNIPQVYGDEILLRQAFINLFQNAIEAMPADGELRINYSVKTGYLEVTISDNGEGIPEDIKDKVFLPFYTTKDKGTGLGLAIVHKIIVSHQGSINFESTEKGTTFYVRLPLAALFL